VSDPVDDDKHKPDPSTGVTSLGDSPALLQRTMVGRRPPASDTQTYTELDHQKISMQAGIEILDRPSLLSALERGTKRSPLADAEPDASSSAPSEEVEEQKYRAIAEIGRGGMGDVYEVKDVDLNRSVALKRIRRDMITPRALALFLQEAQVTAQLEHPNIVPVHDSGRTTMGEAFFTMKRLRGLNLRQVILLLANGDKATLARFSRMRLGITFLEVVRAVAYAHVRGVVHCDLKPSNILIGEHGEVVVGDWGLARRDPLPPPAQGYAPVEFPPDSPDQQGVVSGSMPYMAPEQIAGDVVDRRADVYALGAILYEMLTYQQLFRVDSLGELAQRIKAGIVPPRERAPSLEISEEIEAICMKCLELDVARRYQSAGELQEAIEGWLTGTRKRALAEQAFHDGEIARAHLEALNAERGFLLEEKRGLEERIKPFDPEQKKQPLWAVEDRLFEVELERQEVTARALDAWDRAASLDDGFLPPQDRLADLHLQLFLEAEARGRKLDEQLHRRQVERWHRGRHATILEGKGTVTLRPQAGSSVARITCKRLEERGKKIVPVEDIRLPREDVVESLVLPMGSYLFELVAPGVRTTRVHVLVGRGTRVELEPRMFPDDVIGKAFVHVPAGPYVAGGDETALNSEPRVERSLPDFFIAKTAVTCAEYAQFLNDLVEESPHLARQHVPRTKPDGGALWDPGPDGRYVVPRFDADGNPMHPDAPVMGVSFFDAEMYASWKAKKDNLPVRLPTEHEWEKAARGADGRFFPWGNGFDPSFCKMSLSRPGRPQPEPVGSFPVDESVYGMKDAAGAIREWTDSFYDPARETRTLRGGAWYFNPHYCRLAFRHGYLPHIVFTNFGFRLAKSAP
jgi:serine/threonine-protein kinase